VATRKQRLYLILLLCQYQDPVPSLPFENISKWDWIIQALVELASKNVVVGPIVYAMTTSYLDHAVDGKDGGTEGQTLCWNLLEKVPCDGESAVFLLKYVF